MALLVAYVVLAIIVAGGRRRNQISENPFDKATSIALKGIFCILIIFHHLFQYLYNNENLFLKLLNYRVCWFVAYSTVQVAPLWSSSSMQVMGDACLTWVSWSRTRSS